MCDSNSIGDDFHYIVQCTHFANDIKYFAQEILWKPKYYKRKRADKHFWCRKTKKILSIFIKMMFKVCSS